MGRCWPTRPASPPYSYTGKHNVGLSRSMMVSVKLRLSPAARALNTSERPFNLSTDRYTPACSPRRSGSIVAVRRRYSRRVDNGPATNARDMSSDHQPYTPATSASPRIRPVKSCSAVAVAPCDARNPSEESRTEPAPEPIRLFRPAVSGREYTKPPDDAIRFLRKCQRRRNAHTPAYASPRALQSSATLPSRDEN